MSDTTAESIIKEYSNRKMLNYVRMIDDNVAIVIKKRPWWLPPFIYNAVIRNYAEIVENRKA